MSWWKMTSHHFYIWYDSDSDNSMQYLPHLDVPLTTCFQPLAGILYYSSKTHHFSGTILCMLLQDYLFAWLFSVTGPKRFIQFHLLYHVCVFLRLTFRMTMLISFSLQILYRLTAGAFLQRPHSINKPGYQDDNLKTSLANIHLNKQIRFCLSVSSHSSFSFIHLIFPISHIPDRLCIHSIKAFWSVFFPICLRYLLLCIALLMHAWSQTVSSIN